jgi:hypothetical protein
MEGEAMGKEAMALRADLRRRCRDQEYRRWWLPENDLNAHREWLNSMVTSICPLKYELKAAVIK